MALTSRLDQRYRQVHDLPAMSREMDWSDQMSIVDQLPALIGVVVGATMSYVSTSLSERSRWRRSQAVRWDERRLTAYTDYGNAVKELVLLADRIAAGRGLSTSPQPLDPDEEALTTLADAAARCSVLRETLRLLADTDTITAATNMNHHAWQLEWFARGQLDGGPTAYDRAFKEYKKARDEYLRCARKSLQVAGPGGSRTSWPPRWQRTAATAPTPAEQTRSTGDSD
ncbi:MAG TPA: hypothetical protein VF444_02645 [Pseudonocardiaceae bacterium]